VFTFQGPFPLTPALSLRERENQGPRCNNSKGFGLSNALPTMLPLPEGEGRGEGERALESEDGGSLAIDCPNSNLRSGLSGHGLKLGFWCFSGSWMLDVGALLVLFPVCFA